MHFLQILFDTASFLHLLGHSFTFNLAGYIHTGQGLVTRILGKPQGSGINNLFQLLKRRPDMGYQLFCGLKIVISGQKFNF